MPKKYSWVEVQEDGTWKGEHGEGGDLPGMRFTASPNLMIIRMAWHKGCDFEPEADGFGCGNGTMGGDWSGIRDSSSTAKDVMLTKALNYLEDL